MTAWETKYFKLAEEWVKYDHKSHTIPGALKRLILHLLKMHVFYRFLFLLLCIKVRWAYKISSVSDFAIQNYSPNYACPIFESLYEWTEMRSAAIETYKKNKEKMLYMKPRKNWTKFYI
ncbi:hypothetical protein DBV15_11740 [Temnothorax longispinosus]|uniref:Peptidase M1 leukotriene A4 hydrolase/aminopeptidase C-terminal domain-containing protein n=1 Tax=Temnothorax longispinosus TaxID=300112 RepID=A0A4S2KX92_9HYME|nr:hypothetical protein DBV15_11740 [Temnothorax longispinosus]